MTQSICSKIKERYTNSPARVDMECVFSIKIELICWLWNRQALCNIVLWFTMLQRPNHTSGKQMNSIRCRPTGQDTYNILYTFPNNHIYLELKYITKVVFILISVSKNTWIKYIYFTKFEIVNRFIYIYLLNMFPKNNCRWCFPTW